MAVKIRRDTIITVRSTKFTIKGSMLLKHSKYRRWKHVDVPCERNMWYIEVLVQSWFLLWSIPRCLIDQFSRSRSMVIESQWGLFTNLSDQSISHLTIKIWLTPTWPVLDISDTTLNCKNRYLTSPSITSWNARLHYLWIKLKQNSLSLWPTQVHPDLPELGFMRL